jgi:hypothetical protein
MEEVRQLLGLATRMQVDAFLQQHEVFDCTVEDLDRDMTTLDRLLAAESGRSQAGLSSQIPVPSMTWSCSDTPKL